MSIGAENALSQDFLSGLALVMAPPGTPQALRATLQFCGSARDADADDRARPACCRSIDPSIPDEVRQSLTLPRPAPVAHLEAYSLLDGLPACFR